MKKLLVMTLVCLLLCCTATGALANQWGLRGGIYDIVSENDQYDAYSATADDGNREVMDRHVNHAILTSRYHSQLIAASRHGKEWRADVISTTAVYQPDDERAEGAKLTHTDDGFVLSYGDRERFVFTWIMDEYVLTFAMLQADTDLADTLIRQAGEGYLFWQSGSGSAKDPTGDAMWQVDNITLDEFNIELIPRSLSDVRRMNMVSQTLRAEQNMASNAEEYAFDLVEAEMWPGASKGAKLAVYSAPDTDSYRSSGGKASVSTSGSMKLLGEYDGWTMVEYEVSGRTSRVGFVHASLMENPECLTWADADAWEMQSPEMWNVPFMTVRLTGITDDPHVSQYEQAYLQAGAYVKGLYPAGDYHAYVAAEQKGQLIWGYVPLRDLEPVRDDVFPHTDKVRRYADFCWKVMDGLIGKWDRLDGMALADGCQRIVLSSDGTYVLYTMEEEGMPLFRLGEGNWRIIVREPGRDYKPYSLPMYELLMVNEANEEMRFGIVVDEMGDLVFMSDTDYAVYERTEYSTFGNG